MWQLLTNLCYWNNWNIFSLLRLERGQFLNESQKFRFWISVQYWNGGGGSYFVSDEIYRLLELNYVKELDYIPHVVNPLTVAGNSDKPRLVLDLRHVNPHLFKFCVKFEGLETFINYVTEGGFMAKFDITSAYHHIKVFHDHMQDIIISNMLL